MKHWRKTVGLLTASLVVAAGCSASTNAAPQIHTIVYTSEGQLAHSPATVELAKCTYTGTIVTATGVARSSEPTPTAGLTLSAADASGQRVAASTGLLSNLEPGHPQKWVVSAALSMTAKPPTSCNIELNVGPPPYPGP